MSHRFWHQFLSSIVLTVAASAANAQLPGTAGRPQPIQGTVRYAIGSKPVEHVVVHCSGTGGISERVTDANGRFSFWVTSGHYECSVRVPGYRSENRSLDILNSGEFLDFRLREDEASSPAEGIAGRGIVDTSIPVKAREEFDKGAAAIALGKKENLKEGASHLERAIAIFPRYLQARLMLGTTYMDLQQFDKAEQAIKETVAKDPKAANALFALGEIYLRQKKDEDAEKVLLQGLQIEGHSFRARLTLAHVYWDLASPIDPEQTRRLLAQAYDQVKLALELQPDFAEAHLLKGNLLFRARRANDALSEFDQYLRLEPKGQFAEQTRAVVERIRKALAQQQL